MLSLAVCQTGCVETPQEFVARFERGLSSRDLGRVEALLTPESRPLVRAMVASVEPGEDNPFAPRRLTQPAEVTGAVVMDDGVMVRVRARGVEREWVLSRSGGRYRLDLLATSSRRPWSSD